MASSAGSEQGSQTGIRTPTNNKDQSHFAGSELSPPGSQTQPASEPSGTAGQGWDVAADVGNEDDKPGASWLNKRAEEEYQRAMEFVVDKDFSLSMFGSLPSCFWMLTRSYYTEEFGDPFDDREMQEELT